MSVSEFVVETEGDDRSLGGRRLPFVGGAGGVNFVSCEGSVVGVMAFLILEFLIPCLKISHQANHCVPSKPNIKKIKGPSLFSQNQQEK